MSHALAAALVNVPCFAPSTPPPLPFSEMPSDEAAGDALFIDAIRTHEAAPWSSVLAGIGCSDVVGRFPLCVVFVCDDAERSMGDDPEAATLLSARDKVLAASTFRDAIDNLARGSGISMAIDNSIIGLDFSDLGEEARLRGAALSLWRLHVRSASLDGSPRSAWACCHGAHPFPDANPRAFRARDEHDLVCADVDAAMRDRAAATLLAACDKATRVFAGSACDAPLGVALAPRAPALLVFPICKRTDKAAWQIPANRGVVLGIGAPCRTGSAAAFSPYAMVSAAARPYSTWCAPRRPAAASYTWVPGDAVRVAGPSSRKMCSYAIGDGSAASLGGGWRIQLTRRAWGRYARMAVFASASVGGSLLLLGLGHKLRKIFRQENKFKDENMNLRSAIVKKERYVEDLKVRWSQARFAPGKAP